MLLASPDKGGGNGERGTVKGEGSTDNSQRND